MDTKINVQYLLYVIRKTQFFFSFFNRHQSWHNYTYNTILSSSFTDNINFYFQKLHLSLISNGSQLEIFPQIPEIFTPKIIIQTLYISKSPNNSHNLELPNISKPLKKSLESQTLQLIHKVGHIKKNTNVFLL